jgi:hypothetical protein
MQHNTGARPDVTGGAGFEVGRCRLQLSKPVLELPHGISAALEAII